MITLYDPTEPLQFESVATIGVFDGVHSGHKKIIDRVREEAKRRNMGSLVVTFHPHPQGVITGKVLPMIIPLNERLRLIESAGIDALVCFTFTKEFSKTSPKRFVIDILANMLRIRGLFVGPDFFFGKNREGNVDLLRRLGKCAGFDTRVVEPMSLDGNVVSSTTIRSLIESGEVREASRYLGRHFSLSGRIIEGERRGRILGFPTANIDTEWELLPKIGVYATLAHLEGRSYPSMTNVGRRPTFGVSDLHVETHLFDFDEEAYGRALRVDFLDRIRDEKKFPSVDALAAQLESDAKRAREIIFLER